jgi:hydrogenase maturation protease
MNSSALDKTREATPPAERFQTLVIGYGNDLRQDDGAGPAVARIISGMHLPGVAVEVCHQLLPEHAAKIATAERVVFIDATLDNADGISVHRIHPARQPEFCGHQCDPRMLLHWAGQLASRVPQSWFIHLPGSDFGIGEGLSPQAERHVRSAVASILRMIDDPPRWENPSESLFDDHLV